MPVPLATAVVPVAVKVATVVTHVVVITVVGATILSILGIDHKPPSWK